MNASDAHRKLIPGAYVKLILKTACQVLLGLSLHSELRGATK